MNKKLILKLSTIIFVGIFSTEVAVAGTFSKATEKGGFFYLTEGSVGAKVIDAPLLPVNNGTIYSSSSSTISNVIYAPSESQATRSGSTETTNVSNDPKSQENAPLSAASGPGNDYLRASFTPVSTLITDSTSLFGAGRLTMYANHDTNAQSLSVIIEDGAGNLVVVDGGWEENGEFLLHQIKDKGGHVNAWLLTHPDSDHVMALSWILENHKNDITIDGIYCSFLEDNWYEEKEPDVTGIVKILRDLFSKLPQETVHDSLTLGEVIEAGSAKIQVLNEPFRAQNNFINNSGVTYLVSMNGTNVVFLGDLGYEGGEELRRYVNLSTLDCDIVQMSHHGQAGVGYEFYRALSPDICLWPTPKWLWDNDNGGGVGSGSWQTLTTRNWMNQLGVEFNYCTKDGDQIIE